MNEERTESFESPLEAVLSETPTEDPPADLKARCLEAVRQAEAAHAPRTPAIWPIVWKGAAGLAAAFAIMVLAITWMPAKRMGHVSDEGVADLRAPLLQRAAPPETTEVPGDQLQRGGRVEARAAASPERDYTADRGGRYSAPRMRTSEGAAPMAGVVEAGEDAVAEWYAPVDAKKEFIPDSTMDRPWRDESGERQKITRKDMKVAVDDIEDAHERASSTIVRAKGYIDTEELRVNERGEGEAVIQARVPVEAMDGVVSQLRELGRVLELRGESEDRTNEYYARGQSIRALAEEEMRLVARYEKEENLTQKRQLYYQIQSIRRQIRDQKGPLKELSNQTHFAFLSLTLVQVEGPRQFLHRLGQSVPTAGAWLAISAIFWLPVLVVVIVVWRRIAGRSRAI